MQMGKIVETHRKNAGRRIYVNRLVKEIRHFACARAVEICVEVVEALRDKGLSENGMDLARYLSPDFACAACQK